MIYFVRSADGATIKIGRTKHIVIRMKELAISYGDGVQLLGTEDGGKIREEALHRRFSHFRVEGEWFRSDPELLGYIRDNCSQPEFNHNGIVIDPNFGPDSPGYRLKDARIRAGMSVVDLSKLLDLSQVYIYEIEGGRRMPSLEAIIVLSIAVGIDPRSLSDSLRSHSPEELVQEKARIREIRQHYMPKRGRSASGS